MFIKKFDVALQELDHSLVVEIVDICTVSASRVYCGCVQEMFRTGFLIDLIYIPVREMNIIVVMD